MSSKPTWAIGKSIGAAFAERRIYIRTEDKTRYLSVPPAAQVAGAVAVAAVLGWTVFTTSTFVTGAMDGRTARIQLETMSEANAARLAAYGAQQSKIEEQLDQANRRRDAVTERLSEKQARLVESANKLREAEAELETLRDRFETLITARRDDATRIAVLEDELAGLRDTLVQAETSKANIDGVLGKLGGAMDKVIAERDRATGEATRLGGQVTQLTGALGQLEDRQERLLSQLEDVARTSLAGLETLFGRTNVNLDQILTQARRDYSGAGGPYVPATGSVDDVTQTGAPEDTRIAALMSSFDSIGLMRFAADRLPFGEPIHGGRRTSGFGPRRDPKGGKRGLHTGFDIAAPRGTAIYSTADGVVTFAGRQSGYGIVVKIRHAFGYETIYAHNSRARVKVGQRVSRGDRIADVGSTGRSTGNHVHYEIRVGKKPVNPGKFIEAPRNVL